MDNELLVRIQRFELFQETRVVPAVVTPPFPQLGRDQAFGASKAEPCFVSFGVGDDDVVKLIGVV